MYRGHRGRGSGWQRGGGGSFRGDRGGDESTNYGGTQGQEATLYSHHHHHHHQQQHEQQQQHNRFPAGGSGVPSGSAPGAANRYPQKTDTLHVHMTNCKYPVDEVTMQRVFAEVAAPKRVAILPSSSESEATAIVQFSSADAADSAFQARHGRFIFPESNCMQISYTTWESFFAPAPIMAQPSSYSTGAAAQGGQGGGAYQPTFVEGPRGGGQPAVNPGAVMSMPPLVMQPHQGQQMSHQPSFPGMQSAAVPGLVYGMGPGMSAGGGGGGGSLMGLGSAPSMANAPIVTVGGSGTFNPVGPGPRGGRGGNAGGGRGVGGGGGAGGGGGMTMPPSAQNLMLAGPMGGMMGMPGMMAFHSQMMGNLGLPMPGSDAAKAMMSGATGTVFVSIAFWPTESCLQDLFTLVEAYGSVVTARRGQNKPEIVTLKMSSPADADAVIRFVRQVPYEGKFLNAKRFPAYAEKYPCTDDLDPRLPETLQHDFTLDRHRTPSHRCKVAPSKALRITQCRESEEDILTYLASEQFFPVAFQREAEGASSFRLRVPSVEIAVKLLIQCQNRVAGEERSNVMFIEDWAPDAPASEQAPLPQQEYAMAGGEDETK